MRYIRYNRHKQIFINRSLTGNIKLTLVKKRRLNSSMKRQGELNEKTFEVCPYCNNEVLIDADKSSKCPICTNTISPCTTCDRSIDCCKCNK